MNENKKLAAVEGIDDMILIIRGRRVILDANISQLYGVTTRRLKEQVRRNRRRFPKDFMFELTPEEKAELVANCDQFNKLKHSKQLPYAFTEHGTLMLANVLNSPCAVNASIQVVRAFVRLRETLIVHKDLARQIANIEKKYDSQFKVVFDAIRQLMAPQKKKLRKIGF